MYADPTGYREVTPQGTRRLHFRGFGVPYRASLIVSARSSANRPPEFSTRGLSSRSSSRRPVRLLRLADPLLEEARVRPGVLRPGLEHVAPVVGVRAGPDRADLGCKKGFELNFNLKLF